MEEQHQGRLQAATILGMAKAYPDMSVFGYVTAHEAGGAWLKLDRENLRAYLRALIQAASSDKAEELRVYATINETRTRMEIGFELTLTEIVPTEANDEG